MDVQRTDKNTVSDSYKFLSMVNNQGRVTIPIEVRKFLNVKSHTLIEFQIKEGNVHVSSQPMSLEDTFGSVTSLQPEKKLEEIIQEAKETHYNNRFRKKMT